MNSYFAAVVQNNVIERNLTKAVQVHEYNEQKKPISLNIITAHDS